MVSVDRLEEQARQRLSPEVFDFFAGGAADERTLSENRAAWQAIPVSPGLGVGLAEVDCSVELLGQRCSAPIVLAPIAAQRLAHPDGEVASAQAAGRAGLIYCLSTRSTADLGEVAAAAAGRLWFQLYVRPDRERVARILERARHAGYERVVLTADLPVLGRRERDLRHGLLDLPEGVALATHLGHTVPERRKPEGGGWDALTWKDLGWILEHARLPVIVKGVLTAEDGRLAWEHGAEAIVVSNHGGRQLDGVLPTAVALADLAHSVPDELVVIVDGGVRDGLDVFRALALGARAVMIGRPYLWALSAGGEQAVSALLEGLIRDLRAVMATTGCRTVDEIAGKCGPARRTFQKSED
jgi:4-hydroxymandelate oxidase